MSEDTREKYEEYIYQLIVDKEKDELVTLFANFFDYLESYVDIDPYVVIAKLLNKMDYDEFVADFKRKKYLTAIDNKFDELIDKVVLNGA